VGTVTIVNYDVGEMITFLRDVVMLHVVLIHLYDCARRLGECCGVSCIAGCCCCVEGCSGEDDVDPYG